MVDFTGHILPFDLESASSALVSPVFPGTHDRVTAIEAGSDGAPAIGAAFSCNEPVAILHSDHTGYFCKSFFHDYYERVWLLPDFINFGAITRDQSAPMLLWNSWLEPVTIESISLVDLDNLTIAGPASGYTFPALTITDYSVDVLATGNPLLDGTAIFSFLNDEVRNLIIKGVRAYFWELIYWPNWRDSVRVIYEYRTEIIVSRSGLEQRRALRDYPRKRFEFTSTIFNTPRAKAFREFRRFLDAAQNKTTVLPEFPRRVSVVEGPVHGTQLIRVVEVPAWLVAGRMISLRDDEGAALYLVNSVGDHQFQITQVLSRDWSPDTVVIAAVNCRLPDSIQSSDKSSSAVELGVELIALPGQEPVESFDEGTAGMVFDGREVFTLRPNWIADVGVESLWPQEEVDAGFGVVEQFRVIQFPARVTKAQYLFKTAAEVESLCQFFWRMRGRAGEFFMPTYEEEFTLRLPAPVGSNRIRVVGTETLLTYAGSLSHKAILVRMTDGSLHAYKIATMFEEQDSLGDDTVIEFSEVFLTEVGGPATASIDWLLLSRFATDILTIPWQTITVASVDLAIQTLVYSEAE